LEERAMKTPNSKQAIRIRWYGLWLNRRANWYAFDFMMKIIKEFLHPYYSGVELYDNRRCKVRFPLRTYGNDRKKELSFRDVFTRNLDNDKAIFPFLVRNISGQVKTYENDRKILNDRIYYKELTND
jgi:hypothetical protein